MNIFALDNDPVKAAQMMCDKHVVKMILETRDLLRMAMYPQAEFVPSELRRYKNHPCTKWARKSRANFQWLWDHGKALCAEYTYRYGKTHKFNSFITGQYFEAWSFRDFELEEATPFVQCMLPEYFDDDPVVAYRNYYMGAKTKLLKYTRRAPPQWMQDLQMGEHKDNATI
jgi:hypothetical protein